MFERLRNWIFSDPNSRNDYTDKQNKWVSEDFSNNSNDIILSDPELKNIHDKIHKCLNNDDYDYCNDFNFGENDDRIDETLRLMSEETQRWLNDNKHDIDFIDELNHNEYMIDSKTNDPRIDELLGYCIRLERNNVYLLNLVERFEQVSFKKRYGELLQNNEKLQNEYNRLKNTNSKVYTSYCDLIEDIKKTKLENEKLRQNITQLRQGLNTTDSKTSKLENEISNLKKENQDNLNRMKELRRKNVDLQRQITAKEQEIISIRGANMATKLKLETAERVLQLRSSKVDNEANSNNNILGDNLEQEENNNNNNNNNKQGDGSSSDEHAPIVDDDTIFILQSRFRSKQPV